MRAIHLAIAIMMLAACTPPTPPEATPEPPTAASTTAAARPPAWTAPVQSDQTNKVAVTGDTVVVAEKSRIRGLDRASGRERWNRSLPKSFRYQVADGQIVAVEIPETHPAARQLTVIDAATGEIRWEAKPADALVSEHAVYTVDCADPADRGSGDCTLTAHDVRDGHPLWPSAVTAVNIQEEVIGIRPPASAQALPYLAAPVAGGDPARPWAAIDTTTGTALPGRMNGSGWTVMAAGDDVVVFDHDPPAGSSSCEVTTTATNARTGQFRTLKGVFSGRRKNGECQYRLSSMPLRDFTFYIGAGTQIAAVTADGKPQLYDLATGAARWVSTGTGVPIDGNDHSILVREYADDGKLSLLDFATGATRWTAPNPRLEGSSASWDSVVTDRLAVVVGTDKGQGVHVIAYDTQTGHELARIPGWLAGAGNDWLAVSTRDGLQFFQV